MLGKRLKNLRTERKLSQKQLSSLLSCSSGYISELEQGKKMPGSDVLISLKRAFGVNIDWLLTGEGEPYPQESPQTAKCEEASGGVVVAADYAEFQHMGVVKRFKNKIAAIRMNENLADIEEISPAVFDKVDRYIEDTAETVRLTSVDKNSGGGKAGDAQKKNRAG